MRGRGHDRAGAGWGAEGGGKGAPQLSPCPHSCSCGPCDVRAQVNIRWPPARWLPGDCTRDAHLFCLNVAVFTDLLVSKYSLMPCWGGSESSPGRYPQAVEVVAWESLGCRRAPR